MLRNRSDPTKKRYTTGLRHRALEWLLTQGYDSIPLTLPLVVVDSSVEHEATVLYQHLFLALYLSLSVGYSLIPDSKVIPGSI